MVRWNHSQLRDKRIVFKMSHGKIQIPDQIAGAQVVNTATFVIVPRIRRHYYDGDH